MKARSILAALLLLLACVQTSMGQGFRVYKSDGTVAQFSLRTDSIVFYDGIGTDQDFGPFTPLNDLIVGKWYRTKKEWIVFNEDGTTSGWDNAWNQGMHGDFIYRYFPYQGNIVIYERTTNKPLYFMRVLDRDDERIVTTTAVRQVEEIEVLTRTEPPQLVESIMFKTTEYNLLVHDTVTIVPIVYPEDADNREVSWESTNVDIATITNDGLVQARKEGNCWIYCRATDGSGVYGMCHVIVITPKPVEQIELNKRGINLTACQTYQLTPTIYPSDATNKNVVWTSDEESVASVDENGLVTANGEGFCIITCTAADGSGVKAKCEVKSYFPEYVEIGGLKWATKNVGAETVAGEPQTCYGNYFAWSETSPRYSSIYFTSASEATITMKPSYPSGYSVSHYVSYNNGSSLDAAHDAATQNMGTGWFTPSKDHFTALAAACGNQWKTLSGRVTEGGIYTLSETQTYEPGYTGVAGMLFVSTSDITKRVFFPNAGYIEGTGFYSGSKFWSSDNSGTGKPYYFNAGTISNDLSKPTGLPVRGVSY